MALGLPEHLARATLSHALNRAAQAAAAACLLGTIAIAIVAMSTVGIVERWVTLPGCLAMAAALAVVAFRPTVVATLVFLLLGAGMVFMSTVLVFDGSSPFPNLNNPVFTLPVTAMVLVGGSGVGTRTGVIWSVVGYLIGEAAILAGCLVQDVAWAPSVVPTFTFLLVLVARLYDGFTRRTGPRRRTGLDLASTRARELSLRHDVEVRAIARLNDTALRHLVAIAAAGSGRVDDRLRSDIRSDLSLIVGRDWAIDEPESGLRSTAGRAGSSDARHLLPEAFEAAENVAVEVRVTGDLGPVGSLTDDRAAALDAAVAQCLVNVGRHAGVDTAELVVGVGGGEFTVAVIDSGSGFDLASIPDDRIGIRTSIRARVEQVGGTARLWSTEGVGTTIVLTMPIGGGA